MVLLERYLPPWTKAELSLMQPYTTTSADHVQAAFKFYGGVPRYVFEISAEPLIKMESALRSVEPGTVRSRGAFTRY